MKFRRGLCLIVLVAIYVACSQTPKQDSRFSDKRVVLQLGDNILTMADIAKKFAATKFRTPQDEYERKRGFVEQSLERFLLIEGAREAGVQVVVDTATVRRYLLKNYYNDKILSRLKVTDNEVRGFFQKYGGEIQVGLILVADSSLADSLYNVLKKGGDFGELAQRFSQHDYSASKGGSLGYITYGGVEDKLLDAVFHMRTGEFSKPIHTRIGWDIVKVFDRIKTSPDDLETNYDKYQDFTSQYLQKKRVKEFVDETRKRNHYQVIKPTIQLLIARADSVKAVPGKPQNLPSSAYLDSSLFTDAELRLPLVTYDGGGVTVKDYLDLMKTYSPQREPELRDTGMLDEILEGMAFPALLEKLAKKEGFDRTETFLGDIGYWKGSYLSQKMTDRIYSEVKPVTDEDIAKYYDEHRDQFYFPDQIRASGIAVKTQKEAEDLLARLKAGADFAQLARKYSIDRTTAVEGGDLNYFTVARNTEIYKAAENMQIGQVGGLVQMSGNWWIFKLTGRIVRQPKRLDLVKADIRSQLRTDWHNQAYHDWIDARKAKAQYTMNLDLVKSNLEMGPLSEAGTPTSNQENR